MSKTRKRTDRINSLPDDILLHMVSYLSAKEAAFASLLSKRWRNLCTIIQNIEFDETQGDLTEFLNGVLALPPSLRIKRFSITCKKGVDVTQKDEVNLCLDDVLKKRGVFEVKLDIKGKQDVKSLLFLVVFTSKTVVKLDLKVKLTMVLLPDYAFLPALRTFVVESLNNETLKDLLYACPLLVNLKAKKWKGITTNLKGTRHTTSCKNYYSGDVEKRVLALTKLWH